MKGRPIARNLLFAALLLVVGGLIGNGIARLSQSRHLRARAVMTLAQFHLQALRDAVRAGQCPAIPAERERLVQMHEEMAKAFPLAYARDPEFRRLADALRSTAKGSGAVDCANAVADTTAISASCEDCHRQYR